MIEDEVVPTCAELGISQIVWSPIAQGVLTGKYAPGAPPPEESRATSEEGGGMVGRFLRDDILERVQLLQPVAADAGLTMAQLAVAWVLQNPNVAAAIVGATRPEQLEDNVKASGVVLEPAVLAAIDAALEPVIERNPALTAKHAPRSRP